MSEPVVRDGALVKNPGSSAGIGTTVLRDQLLVRRERLSAATAADPSGDLGRLLQEVDGALERFDAGVLGICEICREPVESDRLLADPLVRHCLDCLTAEERRALERDLELAAGVQRGLLPPRRLEFGGWEIDYRYEPLGAVSGDHCDLVPRNGGRESLLLLFGDVSGKGVAASILMAHLHALFRGLIPAEPPLGELVGSVNRLFNEASGPSAFATLVAGRLSGDGVAELSNAGHPPPLLVRAGGVAPLPATGLPIGLFPAGDFASTRVELAPGDLLVFYTDGLTEASDPSGREYGAARLAAVLAGLHSRPTGEVMTACLKDLEAFRNGAPRTDDLTLMVVRRAANGSASGS